MKENGVECIVGSLVMVSQNARRSKVNALAPYQANSKQVGKPKDHEMSPSQDSTSTEAVSIKIQQELETGNVSKNVDNSVNAIDEDKNLDNSVNAPDRNLDNNSMSQRPVLSNSLPANRTDSNRPNNVNSQVQSIEHSTSEEQEIPAGWFDDDPFDCANAGNVDYATTKLKNGSMDSKYHSNNESNYEEDLNLNEKDSKVSKAPETRADSDEDNLDYQLMASYPQRASTPFVQQSGSENENLEDLDQTSRDARSQKVVPKVIDPIKVGETFANFNQMESRIKDFGKKNNFHLKKRDTRPYKGKKELDKTSFPKRMALFTCRHFGKPRPVGKGIRNNQKYIKTNCPCQIRCVLDEKREEYVVISVNLEHKDHEQTETSYQWDTFERRLNEDQQVQFVDNSYTFLGAKPSRVVQQIAKVTKKKTTAQDLKNYAYKRKAGAGMTDQDEFIEFLKKHIQEHPDDSVVVYTSEETSDGKNTGDVLRSIFVQTKEMKAYFKSYPEVIHVDSCHNVLSNGYCVTIYSIIDHTKKGKMIGFSIMSGESADIHEASLASLLECNHHETVDKIIHIVLDKSFAEMRAGSNLLPNVSFVLCRFHVEQAFIRKLNTCHFGPDGGKDLKELIRKQFKNMVFAESKTKYDECYDLIKKAAIDEEKKKANSSKAIACKTMVKYINDHWDPIRDLFSYHMLKNQLTLGSYTNNIAENRFMRLKQYINRETTMVKVAKALFSLSADDVLKTEEDLHTMNNSTYQPSNLTDEYEKQLVRVAGKLVDKTVIDLLLKQYQLSKSSNVQDSCTWQKDSIQCCYTGGKCSFACNYDLPCKHVFANRVYQGEVILTEAMIGRRWMPMKQEKLLIKKRGMTMKNLRYKEAKTFSEQIVATLSRTTPQKRALAESMITDIVSSVKQNREITLESSSPEKKKKDTEFNISPRKQTTFVSGGHARGYGFPPKKRRRTDLEEMYFSSDPETEDSDLLKTINEKLQQKNANSLRQCDLDILTRDDISGRDLWLNDNIMESAIDLIKSKYPEAHDMEYPSVHQRRGYSAIQPGSTFVRILHATTTSHWLVVTNSNVPDKERPHHVHLYDSYYDFLPGKSNQVEVIPGVTFQVPYILRETCKDTRKITITPKICTQQRDEVMCGYFAIANTIALLEGKDLSQIVFNSARLRRDLLEMFKKCEVRMFSHTSLNQTNLHNLRVRSKFIVKTKRPFEETAQDFDLVCDCLGPKTYSNTVVCHNCSNEFHEACYLISHELASETSFKFTCYQCRTTDGNYDFINAEHKPKPNQQLIDSLVAELLKDVKGAILNNIMSARIARNSTVIHRISDYHNFETLCASYDLTKFSKKEGLLYDCVKREIMQKGPYHVENFKFLHTCELVKFAICLIGHCHRRWCTPIYMEKKFTELTTNDELETFCLSRESWIKDVNSVVRSQLKKYEQAKNKPKAFYSAILSELLLAIEHFREVADMPCTIENPNEMFFQKLTCLKNKAKLAISCVEKMIKVVRQSVP